MTGPAEPESVHRRLAEAPVNRRGHGQVSRLLTAGTAARALAVTWVEAEPGSEQALHVHATSEQTYVITQGSGEMTVGDERFAVAVGDLVVIPPGTMHAIRALEQLVYVTATTPPLHATVDGDRWTPTELPPNG